MATNTVKNPTNYELGTARLTVLGENKTTGITSIYSIVFTPEPGGTYPQGMVRKNTRDKTMKFNHNGDRGAYVFTKEPIEDRKLSFSYVDDAFYWGTRTSINVDKSILSAMFAGESFSDTNVIKVVGTNGTRMLSTPVTLADPYYMFLNMGKNARPETDDTTGKPVLVSNDDISAYNKYGLTVMIEVLTETDSKKQGVRYVYAAPSMANFTENEDGNMKVAEFDAYCDTLYIDNFLIDGLTSAISTGTALELATSVYSLDTIAVISHTTPAAPTFAGALGNLATVVDSDDGKIFVYKCTVAGADGAATWTALTAAATINYMQGAILRGAKSGTSLSTTATGAVGFVGVKTTGISSAAVAATTKTVTSGSGTEDYIYKVKDFSFTTGLFVAY